MIIPKSWMGWFERKIQEQERGLELPTLAQTTVSYPDPELVVLKIHLIIENEDDSLYVEPILQWVREYNLRKYAAPNQPITIGEVTNEPAESA